MSDILRCPFCGRILEQTSIYNINAYACTDLTCEGYYMTATKDMWQELIRTRKALDVARNGLEYIFGYEGMPKYVIKHIRQVLDQIKNETAKESALAHNKIEFPEYNDGLLEEFDKQFFENGQDDDLTETALEQKDVK